jgi:hypothetical protein
VKSWQASALRLALAAGVAAALPAAARAQEVVGCDFDIADDLGRFMYGSTLHLQGEAGRSSNEGEFYIINATSAENDVDKDGFSLNCTNRLFVPIQLRTPLVNVANPALAIPADNVIITDLPRRLGPGQMARVLVYVELPTGTVAGTYIGQFTVRDDSVGTGFNSQFETTNSDRIFVEVRVLENRAISILSPDSAAALDSLVIRGRAGSRASGVLRIANAGNAPLSDVRISASDLRSESAVGLVIPAQNISFDVNTLSGLAVGDTQRVTVTVNIPRGILGGRYRGTLLIQGTDVAPVQIPLIVIVTSNRGILFANNPVRGDVANIAFNGDPGTTYKVGIFDMGGLLVWTASGQVFAGIPVGGGTGSGPGADFAVNYVWPLQNGRGEAVASGMYLVVVESIVNGQRQLAQDKLMVIR